MCVCVCVCVLHHQVLAGGGPVGCCQGRQEESPAHYHVTEGCQSPFRRPEIGYSSVHLQICMHVHMHVCMSAFPHVLHSAHVYIYVIIIEKKKFTKSLNCGRKGLTV